MPGDGQREPVTGAGRGGSAATANYLEGGATRPAQQVRAAGGHFAAASWPAGLVGIEGFVAGALGEGAGRGNRNGEPGRLLGTTLVGEGQLLRNFGLGECAQPRKLGELILVRWLPAFPQVDRRPTHAYQLAVSGSG